jgi:peptidyl-tRNA hydrolase
MFSEHDEITISITYKRLQNAYTNVQEEFEDTKGVIRIRKSKKNRQHNGQKKTDKQQYT